MIMKTVNDLLHKNKYNEITLVTNGMPLTIQETAIIDKQIIERKNKKVKPSKVLLWT